MLIVEFVNGAHATIHVSTAIQVGGGLRHIRQVILLHGQDGTLETRSRFWGPPPASELAGLQQGAEKAETLQMPLTTAFRVDQTAFSVASLFDEFDEKAF
jgi:hypothetical protein